MSFESRMNTSRRDSDVNLERGSAEKQNEELILTPEQKEAIKSEMDAELNTPIPGRIMLSGRGMGSGHGLGEYRCFEMLPDGKVKTWIEEYDENRLPEKYASYGEEVWEARTAKHLLYETQQQRRENTAAMMETRKVVPFELADYINSISTKHWGEGAVGSRFFEGNGLEDLLETAIKQRGNLDGDDREMVIEKGVDRSALMPECRYLVVQGGGEVGIVRAEDLPNDTEVKVVRTKPGAPCSLVVEGEEFPTVDFGVIVIGPNEKEKPEDSEPTTKEMVWTAHPGLPIRPAKDDSWPEGSTITVADVKAKLGLGAYLQFSRAA